MQHERQGDECNHHGPHVGGQTRPRITEDATAKRSLVGTQLRPADECSPNARRPRAQLERSSRPGDGADPGEVSCVAGVALVDTGVRQSSFHEGSGGIQQQGAGGIVAGVPARGAHVQGNRTSQAAPLFHERQDLLLVHAGVVAADLHEQPWQPLLRANVGQERPYPPGERVVGRRRRISVGRDEGHLVPASALGSHHVQVDVGPDGDDAGRAKLEPDKESPRGTHGRAHGHELPRRDLQALHLPIDDGKDCPLHERVAALPAVVRPVAERAVGVAQEEPLMPGVGTQHAQPVKVALEPIPVRVMLPPLAEEGAAMHSQAIASRMGDDGVFEGPAFGVGEAPEVRVQRRR